MLRRPAHAYILCGHCSKKDPWTHFFHFCVANQARQTIRTHRLEKITWSLPDFSGENGKVLERIGFLSSIRHNSNHFDKLRQGNKLGNPNFLFPDNEKEVLATRTFILPKPPDCFLHDHIRQFFRRHISQIASKIRVSQNSQNRFPVIGNAREHGFQFFNIFAGEKVPCDFHFLNPML